MTFRKTPISRLTKRLMVYLTLLPGWIVAHPMPNSIVQLDIGANGVVVELQLPLTELELAFGQAVNQHPATLIARLGPQLRTYIQTHVRPVGPDGRVWTVAVNELSVVSGSQPYTGTYHELTARLFLQPPTGVSPRRFKLFYNVIIHQLVTHKALVSVRQDWETGKFGEKPAEVGVVELNVPTNTIPPLVVDQAVGSLWRGFAGMVSLGVSHIAAGTDHLLFLLALLLPAPLLLTRQRRWGTSGGWRYSLSRVLWIVTAFTLGHSLTLVAGAIGWVRLPGQPVEVLIAVSILVSAIHAFRPLFAGREAVVAAGFGLVHGLAFAGTLANLDLDSGRMALSILGFNLGIEAMQLLVIAVTMPWLILLSRLEAYAGIRLVGAFFAGISALAWLAERITGNANPVTALVETVAAYSSWLLAGLAIGALVSAWWLRTHQRTSASS